MSTKQIPEQRLAERPDHHSLGLVARSTDAHVPIKALWGYTVHLSVIHPKRTTLP